MTRPVFSYRRPAEFCMKTYMCSTVCYLHMGFPISTKRLSSWQWRAVGVDNVNSNSNRVDKTSGTYHVSGASECTSGATSLHVIGLWTLICIN